jgi:twinkle protein
MSGIIHAADLAGEFAKLAKEGRYHKCFSTGFFSLDEIIKLAPGYLSIVSGVPSSGKSEVMDAIAVNMSIMHKWRWLYFSPENFPVVEHIAKLAEKYIGKRLDKMTKDDRSNALAWIDEFFVWLYPDENHLKLSDLMRLAQIVHDNQPINGMILDPWNEIAHTQGTARDDQYLAVALRNLRRFARQNSMHVAVVAHPNKTERDSSGNYKAPTLYDLNGGAMWRNKADYGMVVHREDLSRHGASVSVQKVKYKWMGKIGKVSLDYDVVSGRFKDEAAPSFNLPGIAGELPL